MAKKILAILLALSFVVAFAACGGKNDDATTAPVETTEDPFAALEETDAPTEVATEAPSADATEALSEAASASAEETTAVDSSDVSAEETTAANAMPQGKEAIVNYFNTAINSAKKDSKSIKSNYMVHAVAGEVTGVPSLIDTLLGGTGKFISGFMGPDDSKANVTWTSAADKNAFFPVEGETWASKLTAADVKDAKIVEKDGKWLIRVTTLADEKASNVQHGKGHNPKAFNVVLPAVVDENIPGVVAKAFSIGTTEMNYPSSTITITVDPATGHVTHANYMMYWTINIHLGDDIVVLPFSTENDYEINW